jgi:peptidyl-dipeptidase Dcp
MRQGMKLENEEIEAIVNNPEEPTFENTIVAFERSGSVLAKAQYAFYNLLSAETSDEMQDIANEIAPEESEHSNNIYLN